MYTMKKIIFVSLMISMLLCLSGCQSIWYLFLNCIVDIAPDRFTFQEDHKELSIPIYSSHSFAINNNELEYLIVMVHGGGLNAGNTFETGQQFIESLAIAKNRFMVLAPQFLEGVDPDEKGLLLWDQRWRDGGWSLSTNLNKGLPTLSSYEVLDRLIEFVTKKNLNIHHIIIMGHSAGGQFVVRYAATNSRHEILEQQGVSIRYVVANPSSYPYLDKTRYQLNSKGEIQKIPREEFVDCPSYNTYKYGMEDRYGYAETLSIQIIRTRLLTRPVMFLLGAEDIDRGWSVDKSCEGEAQGRNRFERGMLYRRHLSQFVEKIPNSQHIWLEIPGIGHNSTEMFTHPKFIKKLEALDF